MSFQPDRCFESLTEAFRYILGQYSTQPNAHVWAQSGSGLVYPRELQRYLFRGECGIFPTTTDSGRRLQAEVLVGECRLSKTDVVQLGRLVFKLVELLCKQPYSLDRMGAMGLLQHYGLPTRMVDFTANLNYAFAFAVSGTSSRGRVAVMPRAPQSLRIVDLMAHPWAERAQRQGAYAAVMTDELDDLKSEAARSRANIKWYEFPIVPSDRDHFKEMHRELLRESDDASAGFLRFHITEYVEAYGKLSPILTEWLLERVLIAPYCYLVGAYEGKQVAVRHRGPDALPAFSKDAEAEHTRRYWSSAYPDHSFKRMNDFVWPAPGVIAADPRTYHPEARQIERADRADAG
jgi:hypothetical protein